MFTGDPYADFVQHDIEQQRWLEKLPVCVFCGEHIQDDFVFYINGEIICEECANDNFRQPTENFIDN